MDSHPYRLGSSSAEADLGTLKHDAFAHQILQMCKVAPQQLVHINAFPAALDQQVLASGKCLKTRSEAA